MESLKMKWNVPNILSIIRLLLLPVFVVLYLKSQETPVLLYWSMLVLVVSGLTDLMDGFIARRFNQITEIGKLLDPLADKLTQIVVLVCLAIRYRALIPVMIICLVKECLQGVGGWILFSRCEIIRGSKWFGKVSTFTFYAAMLLIAVWVDMPDLVFWILTSVVAATMLFSFFSYVRLFFCLRTASPKKESEQAGTVGQQEG